MLSLMIIAFLYLAPCRFDSAMSLVLIRQRNHTDSQRGKPGQWCQKHYSFFGKLHYPSHNLLCFVPCPTLHPAAYTMSGKDAGTPRVFLCRHGETEWSKTGQFTGTTEVSLTEHGIQQVVATGEMVYGKGKLIDPAKVLKVFVSPRTRAVETWGLLSGNEKCGGCELRTELEEWDYG